MSAQPDAEGMSNATDATAGLTQQQLALRPYCHDCGWRRGGLDSWDGARCKCGENAPTFRQLLAPTDKPSAQLPGVR